MKKIFLSCILCLSLINIFAQGPDVDSLKKLLALTKEDTVKVNLLVKLCFYDPSFQQGLNYAEEGLALARKIGYEKGEGDCLHQMGNLYFYISNYPKALHFYLEGLKIREKYKNKNKLLGSYSSIASILRKQGDYKKAIVYFQKGLALGADDKYRLSLVNAGVGDLYLFLNNKDSAIKYFQRSYEYFNNTNDKYQYNLALNGLGSIQLNMGNKELALGYYREAIRNGIAYNDTVGLSQSNLRMAKLYEAEGQADSTILYAKKTLTYAQNGNLLQDVVEAGKLLSKFYQNKDDKEALRYLQVSLAAKDSLYSNEHSTQIQNMLTSESERENENAERERKENEQRKQNIQFALIAFGIISFIILFLLLSRSFITNTKVIEFLGVVALLIVFEFLNLLLHPFLERVTNHSTVLMLLALVCIAALLAPLHHKIEKWATAKLVEKNKKIRLAAAKKTIEQLEKENNQNN